MFDDSNLSIGFVFRIFKNKRFGNAVSQEITQDILLTPGFPLFINRIAIWMVAINPIAKFALCTRFVIF